MGRRDGPRGGDRAALGPGEGGGGAQDTQPAHAASEPTTTDGEDPAEPKVETEPEVETEPVGAPSAVELAVAFGRVLRDLGARALDRLRPRSVLYLHLAAEAVQGCPGTGVVRVDDPLAGGPISADQLRAWVANDRITVKPVLDPTGIEPVDGYEIPRPPA